MHSPNWISNIFPISEANKIEVINCVSRRMSNVCVCWGKNPTVKLFSNLSFIKHEITSHDSVFILMCAFNIIKEISSPFFRSSNFWVSVPSLSLFYINIKLLGKYFSSSLFTLTFFVVMFVCLKLLNKTQINVHKKFKFKF